MKMNQEKNQLFKEFTNEMWLYLDGDLSDSKMQFWEDKIQENQELKKYIEEYEDISKIYGSKILNLDADKFNSMVDKAIGKKWNYWSVKNIISNLFSTEMEFAFGKIAFASVLIIGAVVVSLISNRPNPVVTLTENISSEILEWDADYVDTHINRLGNLLKVASDDDYRKYYKYKLNSTNVDKNIIQINATLEDLKKDINNKNL